MAAPVSDCCRACVAECHVACSDRSNLCSKHPHAFYICVLPFHIGFAHEDFALHVHKGADCRGCHAKQNLSDGVVDFVGTCVVAVFALEVEAAAVFLAHAAGIIKR